MSIGLRIGDALKIAAAPAKLAKQKHQQQQRESGEPSSKKHTSSRLCLSRIKDAELNQNLTRRWAWCFGTALPSPFAAPQSCCNCSRSPEARLCGFWHNSGRWVGNEFHAFFDCLSFQD